MTKIQFTPFASGTPSLNKGVFRIECPFKKAKVSIFTTHFTSGEDKNAVEARRKELELCENLMKKASKSGYVVFNGDLNINAFSREFMESTLSSLYINPYLGKASEVSSSNQTATSYFEKLVFTPPEERSSIIPNYDIFDYSLSLKRKGVEARAERIFLYDIHHPEQALSDHHALLTEWRFD